MAWQSGLDGCFVDIDKDNSKDNDKDNAAGYIADDKIRFEPHGMAIRLLKIAVWCLISDKHS